jgi:hypothetical protein
MNKRTIESDLVVFFETIKGDDTFDDLEFQSTGLKKVRTFSDEAIFTRDNGLVLTFESGEQFQLTIKRSK